MNIETKYNIGDSVFFIDNRKINKSKIIQVGITGDNHEISYIVETYTSLNSGECFPSAIDLSNSLLESYKSKDSKK